MSARWIKLPGPGQWRGEGEWTPFDGTDAEWAEMRATCFLPTREAIQCACGQPSAITLVRDAGPVRLCRDCYEAADLGDTK